MEQRKIAAARQKTDEMAEKLRVAELELTKRQNARDPAALREQLERVRNEKVSLDQQLRASEHRAKLLEAEKEDLARRLALLSLDKTAKKRWSESKNPFPPPHESPSTAALTAPARAPSVVVVDDVNTAGTNDGISCRPVHHGVAVTGPAPPTPPARPDSAPAFAAQKSPLASTLTNVGPPGAGRGDGSSSKKQRPPPPAR